MRLRKVEKSDNEILAQLIRAIFDELDAPKCGTVYSDPKTDTLFENFQEPKAVLWIAEENNEIVGCCGVYPTEGLPENCAELVKFYLLAQSRCKGIGKELMCKTIESAKELGYKQLYLESLPQFASAVLMYEKQGFWMLDQPLGDSGHTSCTIWMLKNL